MVSKSFESTCYLILIKRVFAVLSVSFIECMCCLNIRCCSSCKHKYLASLTIFIFCPIISRFICFFIYILFLLNRIISVLLVFNEICLLWASEQFIWDQNLSFCWCLWGTWLSRANLYHQQGDYVRVTGRVIYKYYI